MGTGIIYSIGIILTGIVIITFIYYRIKKAVPDWFTEYGQDKVIWKICETRSQRELLEELLISPPFSPSEVSREYTKNKIHKDDSLGESLRKIGFELIDFEDIKEHLRTKSPVVSAGAITTIPRIDDEGFLVALEGDPVTEHYMLIYGFDDNLQAFKVRWYLSWFGEEGWIPYELAKDFLVLNYGYYK